jgi:MFS family permease
LAYLAGHILNYSIIFLAIEWFDSHSLAGIGFGLCFGPPIILGWFAGVYCDRYSPRKVLLVAQNSFFIAILLLWLAFDVPVSESGENQRMLLLLAAALFCGIGWSFVAPARFAVLPFYIAITKETNPEKDKRKLTTATIILNLMVMIGFGLAPMIIKQIINLHQWKAVLLTASIMFALSSLIIIPLTISFTTKTGNKAYREIKASVNFVKNSPYLTQLLLIASIAYLLMGPMQVILPSIAKDNLNLSEIAQGNYLSLVAFSLIIGGLLAMVLKRKGKLGWQLILTTLCAGLGIGFLAIVNNTILSVSILSFSAICGGIAISFIVAGLQHYSNDEHRGRVMSFYTIISQVVPAASGIGAGLLAQAYSPNVAMIIVSSIIVGTLIITTFLLKHIRQLASYS